LACIVAHRALLDDASDAELLALARGEKRVLGEAEARDRRMAVALLRQCAEPIPAPLGRREPADRLAVEANGERGRHHGFAGWRRHQLGLAVPGDAGAAEDLAGAGLKGDLLEVDAEGLPARDAQALHGETHGACGTPLMALDLGELGPDHQLGDA